MRFTKWGKRKGRQSDGNLSIDEDTMMIPSEDQQHTVKVGRLSAVNPPFYTCIVRSCMNSSLCYSKSLTPA